MPVNSAKPPNNPPRAGFPASPCTRICALDAQDQCLGCKRTLADIVAWTSMSADQQWHIIGLLGKRGL